MFTSPYSDYLISNIYSEHHRTIEELRIVKEEVENLKEKVKIYQLSKEE
jgi:hypothetical protein